MNGSSTSILEYCPLFIFIYRMYPFGPDCHELILDVASLELS